VGDAVELKIDPVIEGDYESGKTFKKKKAKKA
jgi:hypothetical protein